MSGSGHHPVFAQPSGTDDPILKALAAEATTGRGAVVTWDRADGSAGSGRGIAWDGSLVVIDDGDGENGELQITSIALDALLMTDDVPNLDAPAWVGPMPLWVDALHAAGHGEVRDADGLGDLHEIAGFAARAPSLCIARLADDASVVQVLVYVGVPSYVGLIGGPLGLGVVALLPATQEHRRLVEALLAF